jgi:hypothetical protein
MVLEQRYASGRAYRDGRLQPPQVRGGEPCDIEFALREITPP